MALKKVNKLYYSIGEVSEITNLKQYVQRYWETEFSILNPSKNAHDYWYAVNQIMLNSSCKISKYWTEEKLISSEVIEVGKKESLNS